MEPFEVGMRAVQAAHRGLAEAIAGGRIGGMEPVAQDKGVQLRYTRNADFTDEVAGEYLKRLPTPRQIAQSLAERELARFVAPWVMAG
jgi:hypothetical protein